MIFQEPMTSLNPVFTVGDQISEALQLHDVGGDEAMERAVELIARRDPVAPVASVTTPTSSPAACASAS